MKPTKLILHLAALLGVVFTTDLHAQTTAFTYQGFLTEFGAPANGPTDFEFKLYDDPSAGAQQGSTVTLGDVGVTNGLFTVSLDFGGTPFTGQALWLDIAVRPGASAGDYTNVVPRQPIAATPYAIRAASFSGSVQTGQLVGTISSKNIAAGTITSAMLANGAVGSNQLAAGAVTTTALASGAVTADKILSQTVVATTIITNPTPLALDQFGFAIALLGTDKFIVGANLDDAGAANAGAAHLFDSSGNWLLTLTNPTPALDDNFGYAVAAVGGDKALIGEPQDDTGALNTGRAYLFDTSGNLLLSLTNPSPSNGDGFGWSVAAIGSDRFAIASLRDNAGSGQFGAVFIYDLAGNIVQTITNPTPAGLDAFGASLATVGTDKLLIGASSDDLGANNAGVAHLFSTNGTLLTTITNPTPAADDNFGAVVSTVGSDKVLIAAPGNDTGATNSGTVYLFNLS